MSAVSTIGIVVFDDVLMAEVTGFVEVFALARQIPVFAESRVLLIGVEPQASIRTEEGLRLMVDATIADELALDVLLVPGANDVDSLLAHADLNAFIQRQAVGAQWVGSVCAGAFILGQAGVLDGRQATTWHGGEAQLQTQFPTIQVIHNQPVVLDQRRVTANGGLVSYRAALVLLSQLSTVAHAREVYQRLGIDRLGTWAEIEASLPQAG
ncbi:MAG: DJ-1/PfpI family protein [Anaerolineae bacterium]